MQETLDQADVALLSQVVGHLLTPHHITQQGGHLLEGEEGGRGGEGRREGRGGKEGGEGGEGREGGLGGR